MAGLFAAAGVVLLGAGVVANNPSLLALGNALLLLVVIALLVKVWRNGIGAHQSGEQVSRQLVEVQAGIKDLRRRAARLQDGVGTLRARQIVRAPGKKLPVAAQEAPPPARPPALRFSALDYWSRRHGVSSSALEWLTKTLVKHRSEDGRDSLAYAATGGEMSHHLLSQSLAVQRSRKNLWREQGAPLRLEPRPAIALARVLYRQRLRTADLHDAISLYEQLVADGCRQLQAVDHAYLVDALTATGRVQDALGHFERTVATLESLGVASYLRANMLNPNARDAGDENAWLRAFNHEWVASGLEPVGLIDGSQPPFYRLRCNVAERVDDGPLVSVLMPVFEANEATDLAISSILAQTWSNLELIIVDDGSAEEHRGRLRAWEGRDRRLRIIYNDINRGAYWARNTAYAAASGEFVTVADKDDWHHPRKIEIQARDLLDDPQKIANMTSWVRVDERLRFLVRWGPMRISHPSFASIFFRRSVVKDRLGYWDNVRKSGDGEFKGRFKAVFGVDLQPMSKVPLAISLLEADNLTSTDLGLGFEHPNRTVYRKTYEQWHKGIGKGQSPYLEMDPAQRPFPAPREFLPERPEHPDFDVVFASEFGFVGGSSRVLENEVTASIAAGLRVGVVLMENMLISSAGDRGASPYMHRLILDGKVTRLALTDAGRTRLLLIRWPAVLQWKPGLVSRIDARSALVIANHAPYENGDRRYSYDPLAVTENVRQVFGVDPLWAPESARIRELLAPLLPAAALYEHDWPGVLPQVPADPHLREEPVAEKPVVGRHSRDAILKWPQERVLRQVYPLDGEFHVRILGGIGSILEAGVLKAGEVREWTVHQFGAMPPTEFLRSVDFFVYYHHPDLVESYGMTIVEAMVAGVVVVLPPHFEPVFGRAAVYATPEEVRATVWRLWSDWGSYREQVVRGHQYLRDHVSPQAFVARLQAFGVEAGGVVDHGKETA